MNDLTRYSSSNHLAVASPPPSPSAHLPVQSRASEFPATPPAITWDHVDDEAALDSFDEALRDQGIGNRPAILAVAKLWYVELLKTVAKTDKRDVAECIASLRQRWKADYPTRMKLLQGLMTDLPDDVELALLDARDETGTKLLNMPDVVDFLVAAKLALSTPGKSSSINPSEREQLEAMMRNLSSDYWRGPRSEKLKARYRELIDSDIGGGR